MNDLCFSVISYNWVYATASNKDSINFLQYFIRVNFSAGIILQAVSSRRLTKPRYVLREIQIAP